MLDVIFPFFNLHGAFRVLNYRVKKINNYTVILSLYTEGGTHIYLCSIYCLVNFEESGLLAYNISLFRDVTKDPNHLHLL